ncbi:MAG: penicillin-binding protein 2 [Verrucomicrobia bacterium]|nr:penicillin-binding protein 2 [Verrucomicrobiota bacterium]
MRFPPGWCTFVTSTAMISLASAQEVAPTPSGSPLVKPSWETQKQIAAYTLSIPAPRGQITDRNGLPLAQNRVSYNLSVVFPTPLNFTDQQIIQYVQAKEALARTLTGRAINVSVESATQHYRNRGIIPFDLVSDLPETEVEAFKKGLPEGLALRATYVRFYPQGQLAGHVVGYTGRTSGSSTKALQNNDLLWPDSEGREGLEQTFDDQLRGRMGQMNLVFDKSGQVTGQTIAVPPEPGYNVVTTLDADMQRLAEKILQKRCKRGAIVVMDPHNGEVLVLASWPTINPNDFVPTISEERFQKLNSDPNIPLLPRAFRSAYPAGSTFKVFVGVAGFESHKLDPDDEFDCPAAMDIGNLVFHNWRKSDGGSLNFRDALTQSCDTWFYQLGLKLGSSTMVQWAQRLGLGKKTGILLNGEADGRIPTDQYMQVTYRRHFLPGDLANFSIGQGDILVTPLQMAQAMATLANGGTLYQTRIVQQVQTLNGEVVYTYSPRAKDILHLGSVTRQELKEGMVGVVESRNGTAGSASLENVTVAGKTGTAQWGPKARERTAAWFAGFAPADNPQYAFAALYEGAVGEKVHGGSAAAPMIGDLLREVFKDVKKAPAKNNEQEEDKDNEDKDNTDESD